MEANFVQAGNSNLPKIAFMWLHYSLVCFAIERLAVSDSLVKNDFEDWCNVWVMPLLHILPVSASIVAGDIEKVLYKIFKTFSDAIEMVLNKWKDADSDEKLRGVLFCLKIRNKLKGDGAQFVNLITEQKGVNCILEVCLGHSIDDVRLTALTLVIEGATLAEQDLRLVLYFLRYNLNNHRPSTRQKVMALFKKLISRVNTCYLNSLRSTKTKETSVASSVYEQFVADLVNLCYNNIFGGANFNRLNTVLNILLMCKETLDVRLTAGAGVCAASRWSGLLVALASSYEENKAIAVSIAASLPFIEMPLNEPLTLRLEFRRAFGMVQELEPPNVLLGSYLLCILIRVPNACQVLRQYFADCIETPATVADVLCIQVLSRYLNLQLEEARQSRLTAAKQAPMYGTLFAIRLIFNSLEPNALKSAESIKVLQDLVETSFGMADAVSSVVNNISPEGHLPMDFQNIIAEGKKESERTHFVERLVEEPLDDVNGLIRRYKSAGTPEEKLLLAGWIRNRLEEEVDVQNLHDAQWPLLDPNAATWYHRMHETQAQLAEYDCYHKFFLGHLPRVIEEPPVTAQALLLYSWRSMKEACLYLGDLVSKLPLQQAMEDGLLSEDMVTRIGLRLRELLSEIKHRGAFENADIGFSAVCLALWKCPQLSLHALPSLWLKEVMQELILPPEQQSLKFTSTRRSAGLPFLVKTIVATELISNYSSSANALQTTLVQLLDIAEKFKSGNIEPRLHALNILRALFKHTQLGEFVTPYVSRALQIAIEGSRSSTWPERNCSNLLFSALVIRIFGVSRSRDNLSRKNKMTSRLFFQRFPDLYEFLLKEITKTANEESKVGYGVKAQPSLYLVLLLISRLLPPTKEDASNVDLTPFVRVMAQCAGNPIMWIRVLAARALVPFLPPHLIIQELKWRLRILNTRRAKSNLLHGLLLQVVELLDELRKHEVLMEEVQNLEIPTWMLPNRLGDGLSPLSLAGVQMMTIMCRFYPNHSCQPIKMVLSSNHWPEYVYYSKKRFAGADACLAAFAALQVMCLHKDEAVAPSEFNALLRLKDCRLSAVEDVLLQWIYCIFTSPTERDADFDFSLTEGSLEEIELLTSCKSLNRIKNLINSSSLLNSEILTISRTRNLQQRRLRILNYSNVLMEAMGESQQWSNVFNLISIYGSYWDGDGIVRLLNVAGEEVELTDAMFGRVGAAMAPLLDGDKPCRMVLANIYLRANVYLIPNSSNLGIEFRRYWLNLFNLLLDEEEDVRKVAQAAVNKMAAQICTIESVRSMTSLGSQEMLLHCYKRIVCRENPCVDILLMALLTVSEVTELSSSQTLEVFKRGNPNPFSECVALTSLFISEAQKCFDEDALRQPFPGGDVTNKQIYTQLSPHFACYGLRLKPFTLPGQLLDELKRLEQPDNADVDEFWWQMKQILLLAPPKH